MSGVRHKIAIVPCSGIGKTYGTVSRTAAYQVTEDDRPELTRLVPLALLVMGDEEYRGIMADSPAISIDGCPQACATKMVRQSGGHVAKECSVMECYRHHRDLKPQGIAELNEDGEMLAKALAWEIVTEVDHLILSGNGGSHA